MAVQISLLGSTSTADAGIAPYQVKGDPVVALVAQLNRFAGKSVAVGSCKSARYVSRTQPLQAVLTQEAATLALNLFYARYNCVVLAFWGDNKLRSIATGREQRGDIAYVMENLNEITLTLAQLGDQLGFQAADTGITTVDPKLARPSRAGYYIGGGVLLALAGLYAYNRHSRRIR